MSNFEFTAPVEIQAKSATEAKEVTILAYNGGPMFVASLGWVLVDIQGVDFGDHVQLLADHDKIRHVGTGKAWADNGTIVAEGIISPAKPDGKAILAASKDGTRFQASIGATVETSTTHKAGDVVSVNGRTHRLKHETQVVHTSKLREISLLALGADDSTQVDIAAQAAERNSTMTKTIERPSQDTIAQIEAMTEEPRGGWADSRKVIEASAEAKAGLITVGELALVVNEDLRAGTDKKILNQKLADLEARSPGGFAGSSDRQSQADASEIMACGLMLKAGLDKYAEKSFNEQTLEAAAPMRRFHNLEFCKHAMKIEGKQATGDRNEIFASGTTTLSLPNALNNAMHKTLESIFRESPATWRSFCNVKFATDFKDQTGLRPALLGDLSEVGKDGEIKHGGITEAIYQWSVDTFGKMIVITRKDWINDSTNFLSEIAPGLGRMAARKVADLVYKMILADTTFFAAGNNNLQTGGTSVLGNESLSDAITAMRKQTDENGDSIDIMPATLVVPPELEDEAKSILRSQELDRSAAGVDNAPTGNPHENRLSLEVEPRLSNDQKFDGASETGWYVFGTPGDNPITVGFMDSETPNLDFFDLTHDPTKLALGWRVYNDFGTAFAEHRAGYKSAGA